MVRVRPRVHRVIAYRPRVSTFAVATQRTAYTPLSLHEDVRLSRRLRATYRLLRKSQQR